MPSREAIASASSLALSTPICLAMLERMTFLELGPQVGGTFSQLALLKTMSAPMKGATL